MDSESSNDRRSYQRFELVPESRNHRSPHFRQENAENVVIYKIVQWASYRVKLREGLED